MLFQRLRAVSLAVLMAALPMMAHAQDAGLTVELNKVEASDTGGRTDVQPGARMESEIPDSIILRREGLAGIGAGASLPCSLKCINTILPLSLKPLQMLH